MTYSAKKRKPMRIPWTELCEKVGLETPGPAPMSVTASPITIKFLEDKTLGIEYNEGKLVISSDYVAKPKTRYLEDFLILYASPADILKVHNERPDLLRAEQDNPDCDGDCETCDSHSGASCGEEKK